MPLDCKMAHYFRLFFRITRPFPVLKLCVLSTSISMSCVMLGLTFVTSFPFSVCLVCILLFVL